MAPVLGALFAILIGLFAIRPYLDYQQRSFENIRVANTAGQFRQILNAVKSYVQSNYATATGAVTATELAAYLPPNVTLTNPYGQQWNIEVAHDSTGALQALVYSSGGTAIPERLAPEIAAETGAEGGFVPYAGQYGSATSTTAIGAYGYWNLNLNSYNVSPGAGHLVGLLTFGADGSLDNSYLYRMKVPRDKNHTLNTMQTNLYMNGNKISGAQSVQVSSSDTTPFLAEMADTTSNGLPGGMVETKDKNGDSAIMQADSDGANLSLTGASGYKLTLTSTSGTVGQACSPLNAIAPSTSGPVVCANNASGSPVWQAMGSNFTTILTSVTVVAGTSYTATNSSGKPLFISTSCVPQFGGGFLQWSTTKFYVAIQVQDPNGNVAWSSGRQYIQSPALNIGGAADTDATVAPSASAIVPANDSYTVSVSAPDASPQSSAGACTLMMIN